MNSSTAGATGDQSVLALEGTQGVPRNGGREQQLALRAGLLVFYSQLFACSNPHVDRCSNPLPWDPLSSPQTHISLLPLPEQSEGFVYIF